MRLCLLAMLALPSAVRAQLSFTTNNGAITITGCTYSTTQVVIPASTNGYPVTKIGDRAFGCVALTSLELPESIIDIGSGAFSSCFNLTNVVLDANLKSIGAAAFDFTKLTVITIPAGVTNIGNNAFADCASLTNIAVEPASLSYCSVGGVLFNAAQTVLVEFPGGITGSYYIPAIVTNIGAYAFKACTLTNVTLPFGVIAIGDHAFNYCNGLSSVTIPASVTDIGADAFAFCNYLSAVYFMGNAPTADSPIFSGDSSYLTVYYHPEMLGWESTFGGRRTESLSPAGYFLFTSNNGTIAITGYLGSEEILSIPSVINNLPVTSISEWAFFNHHLSSVILPDTMLNIGSEGFNACTRLTNITFGTHLKTIGEFAFGGCTNLGEVALPESLELIGNGAFYNCDGLAQVTIPIQVTNIAAQAFASCDTLTNATILARDASIGKSAFELCLRLTTVTFSNRLTSLGNGAFYGCSNLTSLTIPDGVVRIPDQLLSFCSSLTNLTISSMVTSIGAFAFYGCTSLASINIPDSVTNIDISAFYGCGNLLGIVVDQSHPVYGSVAGVLFDKSGTTLVCCPGGKAGGYDIPHGVTSIGDGAFDWCARLTQVSVPNSVNRIGSDAFHACSSLTSFTIPNSVTNIGEQVFTGCTNLLGFTVGLGHLVYSSVDGVLFDKNQTTLICYPGGRAGGYVIPNGVTQLSVGGFEDCEQLSAIEITAGITNIGDWMFAGCTRLMQVSFPSGVTSIGEGAFTYCASLPNLVLPAGLTGIGRQTFYGCSQLTNITIPNSVLSIGDYAFASCTGLASIVLPAGLTNIADWMFLDCRQLTNVSIPNSVTSIGDAAFSSCTSLTRIVLPDGLTSIGSFLFYGCSQLTNVTIPNSVASIGDGAFSSCTSLPSIVIPAGLTNISYSFVDCGQLTKMYFKGNPPLNDYWEFFGAKNVTLYYLPGKTGWSTFSPLSTCSTAPWLPAMQTGTASFGLPTNQFGFNLNWASGQTVVVEASTNLMNWQPVQTNTLATDSSYFSDPQWTNYPGRFYRLRSP